MEQVTPAEFQTIFAVPRGTMLLLQRYAELLTQWQQRMNLVGPATLDSIWERHFADSAQLARHAPPEKVWLDIGAGGGFPGLPLAILGVGRVVLVESIGKKVRFLEAVRNELQLQNVSVLHARAEQLPPQQADVVTARAVASLERLLDWSLHHVRPGGMLLLPKGRSWAAEVDVAQKRFSFDLEALPSMMDQDARILRVRNCKRL